MEKKTAAAVRLGRKFAQDIVKKRKYRDQNQTISQGIAYFGKIIQMRRDHWRGEYAYWTDRGWL